MIVGKEFVMKCSEGYEVIMSEDIVRPIVILPKDIYENLVKEMGYDDKAD